MQHPDVKQALHNRNMIQKNLSDAETELPDVAAQLEAAQGHLAELEALGRLGEADPEAIAAARAAVEALEDRRRTLKARIAGMSRSVEAADKHFRTVARDVENNPPEDKLEEFYRLNREIFEHLAAAREKTARLLELRRAVPGVPGSATFPGLEPGNPAWDHWTHRLHVNKCLRPPSS